MAEKKIHIHASTILTNAGGRAWVIRLSHPYSKFNMFWMPDQVRHDNSRTFYGTIMVDSGHIVF